MYRILIAIAVSLIMSMPIDCKIKLQPKQRLAFDRIEYGDEQFLLYGGAKGGGKSYLVRASQVIRRLKYAGTKGVIIRKTYPEILKNHIREMLSEFPFLRKYYRASEKCIIYPNGSVTDFQHLQYRDDVYDFQGLDYVDIDLDESTQHDEETFKILKTSNRLNPKVAKLHPTLKPKFLLTGNPGGIGMAWVKRLFIDRDFNPNEDSKAYNFIQANIYDNPIFLNANPEYLQNLRDLPTDLMRAYLEGDWTVFVGQYFTNFRLDVHSVEPFHIDENWGKIFAVDWGYSPHPFSVGWYAVDFDNNIYKYRELLGHETSPQDLGQLIADLSKKDTNLSVGVGDTQMWEINPFKKIPQEEAYTDKSIADEINAELSKGRMYMEQANKARITGWTNLKTMMQWKGEINPDGTRKILKQPKYRIFSTCTETLKAYPNQIHSKLVPEDMQKQNGDDTIDTDRYALMHIIEGIKPVRKKTEVEDFIESIVVDRDEGNREWDNY